MFRRSEEAREAAEIEKIRRYEEEAEQNPKAYTRKVVSAAVVGYAAPGAFLLLLTSICAAGGVYVANGGSGGAAIVKLIIAVGLLGIMVGRSMIVRFDPPQARRLSPQEAPALYEEIEIVRKKLSGPVIHEIYLDDRLNAAIEQAPRFGLFGGHINRLIIGLPLMQALSIEQFRTVIGHEYGHLAGSHGKTGAWIYRTRAMWHRLYEEIEATQGWLSLPLKAFIHRFAPWFDRLSFPLARANEYEADQAGATVSSPQTAADALIRVTLAARYLDETFWPKIWRRAQDRRTPDVAPLRFMAKAFSGMGRWPQTRSWAREELRVKTDFTDTHPALSDRIKALGAKPRLTTISSSAAAILGPLNETMVKKFDTHWKELAGPDWSAAFADAKRRRERRSLLDDKAARNKSLNREEAFERGHLAEMTLTVDEALVRYKEAAQWHPGDGSTWLAISRLLADKNDDRALKCAERASAIDPKLLRDAAAIAHRLHSRKGQDKAADEAADLWRTEQSRHDTALEDVYHIDKKAELTAHDLTDAVLEPIVETLRSLEDVREAHLVRKSTNLFDDFVGYHLIITPKSENNFDYEEAARRLQASPFDGNLFFWFAVQANRWLRKKAARIEGAELHLAPAQMQRAA